MNLLIKKGRHYATLLTHLKFFPFIAFNVKAIQATVKITKEMISYNPEPNCVDDSNKIFGINKDLFSHHHKNSFRISWITTEDNLIKFVRYNYINGEKQSEILKETYKEGDEVIITNTLPYKIFMGRKLFPYYGGDCFAPHDIKLKVKIKYL